MGAAEKALNGKVLVIDDEQELLELITFYLRMNNYDAIPATSAQEALKIVSEEDIQFIVSDICMPNTNGLELYKQISQKMGYSPKVLFLSGFSDEAEEKAMELGAAAVLSKPIDFAKLINYIQLHS